MKNMRKFLALLLALCMALSLSVSAFAADDAETIETGTALEEDGPVDKVGYFKIAAKKMTWKPRKEPLQEWDTSICLT